ncbi:MAG: hypothetical protein AB8B52_07340 [Winogradskyella sp.]|uniref:hypothetical protein n=1 Tax=Winogradskyella sp. TaxID=1883156 RepID=UPI00385D8048
MKYSLTLSVIFIFSIFFTSCQNQPHANNSVQFYNNVSEFKGAINANTTSRTSAIPAKSIQFKTFRDDQLNMDMFQMPVPSDWKMTPKSPNAQTQMTGNNGFKFFGEQGAMYTYSSDPFINQTAAQTGNAVLPVKTPEQVIKEMIAPTFKQDGVELVKMYKVPELIAYDKNYEQFKFKSGYEQSKTIDVVASEWKSNTGTSSLILVHYSAAYDNQQQVAWGFYLQGIDVDTKHFEQTKKDFIYAQANKKYNPQYLHYFYMKDANFARQSGKLHQQRMANLRAEGQAIIERGKQYSASVDRNHQKFMDAHLERTTVTSNSGQSYKVDAGSNYYWMNNDGQYISSNDPNYDPNKDPNYNNRDWNSTTINN